MVRKAIVCNVRDTKITEFLKSRGVVRDAEDYGMELHLWLTKVIEEGKTTRGEVNECLFKELMYGHRRLMRCYELRQVRRIKHVADWQRFLDEYQCESMNFNKILETNLTREENIKVAAIESEIINGCVQKVNILFVYNMEAKSVETESLVYYYSYLPVTFDLCTKTLTIKVWNREEATENNAPNDQVDVVYARLMNVLDFSTRAMAVDPQKVLYRMSKDLFDDFFNQLPNAFELEQRKGELCEIVDKLLSGISLQNTEVHGALITMNPEVIDVEEEIYKLLQQIVLYDYLKDNRMEDLLENTERYISRIRFNDRDNLAASLASETGIKCIFDAKTFMCVRNSLDLVANVAALVVSFKKDRGLLSVKYDASNQQFLNIHILKNRYYTEEDYSLIWGLYKEYEFEDNANVSTSCAENAD